MRIRMTQAFVDKLAGQDPPETRCSLLVRAHARVSAWR